MGRHTGMAYMRTSRPKTPVIYGPDETFPIGGSKVLRQSANDVAAVVGAGVTVFEALKAYDQLKAEGIEIRVIDAYSRPADRREDDDRGRRPPRAARSSPSKITIRRAGIGDAVSEAVAPAGFVVRRLAVREIPAQRPAGRAHRSLRHLGAAHRRTRSARSRSGARPEAP